MADLVHSIAEGGELVPGDAAVDGVPVVTVTSGDWTLLLTKDEPRRAVWLGGPVESGGLSPSAYRGDGSRIVPAGLGGGDGTVREVEGPSGGGYVSMSPDPGDGAAASKAKSDASDAMSGKGAAPSGMPSPSADASGEAPPEQDELTVPQPEFDIEIEASDCLYTDTCSFGVVVTNTGDAPGSAVISASASPGMPTKTQNAGEIAAGASVSLSFTYTNPAPEPAPGQTTSVTVSLDASVEYSPELDGTDKKSYDRLRKAGIPAETIREILSEADAIFRPALVDAMDRMLDAGAGEDAVTAAVDNAVDQLNGASQKDAQAKSREEAPDGYDAIAEIHIDWAPDGASPLYNASRDTLNAVLQAAAYRNGLKLCKDSTLRLDRLVVTNGTGTYEWTRADICG